MTSSGPGQELSFALEIQWYAVLSLLSHCCSRGSPNGYQTWCGLRIFQPPCHPVHGLRQVDFWHVRLFLACAFRILEHGTCGLCTGLPNHLWHDHSWSIIVESVNMLSIKNQQGWWYHRNSVSISESILAEVSQAHHHDYTFSVRKDIALRNFRWSSSKVMRFDSWFHHGERFDQH